MMSYTQRDETEINVKQTDKYKIAGEKMEHKKIIAFVLMLVCVLYLVSCVNEDFDDRDKNDSENNINEDDSNGQTDKNDQNNNEDNNENNTPVDNDAILKAGLTSKFGMPFRLWRTEGMSLWEFTVKEDSAERGYHNSMEGSFWQKNLSWEIKDGELVITGDWNETFTLDLEAGQAISKIDEAVYTIVKEQN